MRVSGRVFFEFYFPLDNDSNYIVDGTGKAIIEIRAEHQQQLIRKFVILVRICCCWWCWERAPRTFISKININDIAGNLQALWLHLIFQCQMYIVCVL